MNISSPVKQNDDLFEVVLNTVSDGVTVIDNDLRINFQNKVITQLYGSSMMLSGLTSADGFSLFRVKTQTVNRWPYSFGIVISTIMLDQTEITVAPLSTRNIDTIIATGTTMTGTYGLSTTKKGL